MTFIFDTYGQNDTIMTKIEPIQNDSIKIQISKKDTANNYIIEPLVGMLSDPILYDEIGISLIGSIKSPFTGLKLDYSPFIPIINKRFYTEIGYRTDFRDNQILETSIKTIGLFYKKLRKINIQIDYNLINLSDYNFTKYQSFSMGPIFHGNRTSFGILIGQDSFEKEIGVDIYCRQGFSFAKTFYPDIIAVGKIGYWNKHLNYSAKIEYNVSYRLSFGVENRRLYNFNESMINCRYIIFK